MFLFVNNLIFKWLKINKTSLFSKYFNVFFSFLHRTHVILEKAKEKAKEKPKKYISTTQETNNITQESTQEIYSTTQETNITTQETNNTTQETTQVTNITTQETNNTTQETTQETDNTTQETSKKRPRNVQETTQEVILRIIKENPQITQSELSKTIGLTINGIKYHMKKLTKAGIIKHEGPTKSGKWIILKK